MKLSLGSRSIPLLPHVKHYDWGGKGKNSFLRKFLGSKDMRTPFAEAWYGTHPQGPSLVAGTDMTLRDYLQIHPNALGMERGQPTELPFLVKIIDAQNPLSLQVHPNKKQAVQGFRRENAQGIPLDSPHRCFRDANAKPEVIMALGPFDLLAGFLTPRQRENDPLCRFLLKGLNESGSLRSFGRSAGIRKGEVPLSEKEIATKILTLSPSEVLRIGRSVFGPIRRKKNDSRESWLLKLWELYGVVSADPATLLAPFLGFHRLHKGQCMALLPGTVHTYLKGSGLEIMGCSDNVIRLGLTTKKVDRGGGGTVLRVKGRCPVYRPGSPIRLGPLVKIFLSYQNTPQGEVVVIQLVNGQVTFRFSLSCSGTTQNRRYPSVVLSLTT